nr:protein transport protein Sec16A [Pogona vitticeps]
MQPPPQAVPPGAGGPPPLAASRNMYWRSSPLSRRANPPAGANPGPVRPVTDPFAFGVQPPRGSPSGNAAKGDPLVMPGFPPAAFPPPAAGQPPPPLSGDNPHGLNSPWPPLSSQPGASSAFSRTAASFPAHVADRAEARPGAEQGLGHPAGPFDSSGARENSVRGHQGSASPPERPPSEQNVGWSPTHPSSAPSALSFHPAVPQWMGPHGSLPPQGHSYLPYPEPPPQNAAYTVPPTTVGIPQAGPPLDPYPNPAQRPAAAQGAAEAPSGVSDAPSVSSAQGAPWQNPGGSSPWLGQLPQEHFYLQPLETTPTPLHPSSQDSAPPGQPRGRLEAAGEPCPADAAPGTVSMFFKGEEAENEEILSSERRNQDGKADFEASQPTMGHTYYQPLHSSHQIPAAAFASAQPYAAPATEALQKEGEAPPSFRTANVQPGDPTAFSREGKAEAVGPGAPPYENVENQEYVQNQEVLPSEPPAQSHPSPGAASDSSRYALLLGPSLPKSSLGRSNMEGGPNLEAPDALLLQPVRPDSVSSSYSNVSHRSLSCASRPQEPRTFIQQESGKPEEKEEEGSSSSTPFFQQIDSSPLGGDAGEQNPSRSYRGLLSQAPTPSPPKPMGVFQTSANSSFEPVRSQGSGPKPLETDQAKMVAELRENPPSQRSSKKSPAVPVASPGNLEQPPDNLETLLPFQAQPLMAAGNPGGVPPPISSSGATDSVQSSSERRPSARVQGAVKKCESPATTLWAHNELPNFGGNVLLAPAAPAVYVPAKPVVQVVQPPESGPPGEQRFPPRSVLAPQAGHVASENLENPPKMGDEEALRSQASSGYASLLSSPPTEALQNPPVVLAQPNQSGGLNQLVNFSLGHQLSKNENSPLAKDPAGSKRPLPSGLSSSHASGESGIFLTGPPGSVLHASAGLSDSNSLQEPLGAPEIAMHSPAGLLIRQPTSHLPLNLAAEKQTSVPSEAGLPPEFGSKPGTGMGAPGNPRVALGPGGPAGVANNSHPSRSKNSLTSQEFSQPVDYTVAKSVEQSGAESGSQGHNPLLASSQSMPQPPGLIGQAEPDAHQKRFYQQVTKDAQPPAPSNRALPLQRKPTPAASASQGADPPLNPQVPPGGSSAPALGHRPGPAGPPEGSSVLPPANPARAPPDPQQGSLGQPPPASTPSGLPSTSVAGGPSHPPQPPSQPDQQQPPPPQTPQNAFAGPPNPYYYYRHPYDAYPAGYPPPYPPVDPRTAHLYYQEDVYNRYDPSYRPYGSTAAYGDPGSYQYVEPERPSSRASHTSDRPPSRPGYPEDYYNAKSGWSDYYADYYATAYDYGDRYPSAYDPRYRDLRAYDQHYWYDTEQRSYPKREAYPYGNSHDRYEDHWRYDPRFAGSFDEDLEPRRDPYGDEFDRRSVHSEHSGHSLHSSRSVHSRQSSFSSRSQQSQLYRSNHDLTAPTYDGEHPAASLHAEYYPHYMNPPSLADYNHSAQTAWSTMEQVPSRPLTPEKFSVPHICARFGPGGYLVKALPNLPSEGQPALVEIHSMEMIMQHSLEQEEMRAFPGPLTKDDTHKVDVINFAQKRATRCFQDETLLDKDSARLLWDFVVLLCRQNGTVVGTDLAELLLRDHKTVWLPGKSPNEANLIDFTNEALEQAEEESGEAQLSFLTDSLITTIDSLERETERFRELLLYGRKKDALESAMKHGLWGHALLLASKMDNRTHARVMTRFANSLPINDPLQTVYQLMSGRMPAASTCCGDEKWGDWRPHLAMVLSNLTNNMDVESRTIVTMGDTLASKGLLDAAHFCYLMAQVGFGVYTKKTAKLVLIGSNHSLPFLKFATNEAIRRTEAYEYAQSLGTQPCCLPNFQVFKFIYACRLAEMGLAAQAFHYCEVISKAILKNPYYYSPVLIGQVIQVSAQLRLFDPQIKEKPEQELFIEPDWLVQLRHLDGQIQEGSLAYAPGRSTPQQYACSTPSSELDRVSQSEGMGSGQEATAGSENPLLASLLPGVTHAMQGVRLMPSAPPIILDGSSSAAAASSQPEASSNAVPFYPAAPAGVGPVPGFPGPVYPGGSVPPVGPPPPLAFGDLQPQESGVSQEAAQGAPPESHVWRPEPREEDFYAKMASMGSGRRSRSTSQSSAHMGFGQRSRTTSESSVHSVGRERQNSAAKQPSPPPPSIPEGKESKKESRKEPAPRKSGATWFGWLMGKGRNEAHLPDDKNKSIVWDEKKQRWVNLDEPEEETKPPPPPPSGFPQVPQAAPSGPGGPPNSSVNMFSRRAAGSKARYVDILNPSRAKSPGAAPAPSELFAPLAPMPIPANLFVPNPGEPQPLEGSVAEEQGPPGSEPDPDVAAERPYLNSAAFPPGPELPPSQPEGSRSGELSRSSSMSSLSREVSQHFNQSPSGGPLAGVVQFYNPSQFTQPAAGSGSSRPSRIGQRKYPTLK